MSIKKVLLLIAVYMAIPIPLIILDGTATLIMYSMFVVESLLAGRLFIKRDKSIPLSEKSARELLFVSVCFLKWSGYIPFALALEYLY